MATKIVYKGEIFELEALERARDFAYEHFCDMQELYGDHDEDVEFAEREYLALDDMLYNSDLLEEA